MKILFSLLLVFSLVFPEIAISKVNGRKRSRVALSRKLVRQEGQNNIKTGELNMSKPGGIFNKIEKDTKEEEIEKNKKQECLQKGLEYVYEKNGNCKKCDPGFEPNKDRNQCIKKEEDTEKEKCLKKGLEYVYEKNENCKKCDHGFEPNKDRDQCIKKDDTLVENEELKKLEDELKAIISSFDAKVGDANKDDSCIGISKKLDMIDKLSVSTAVLSAGTTALSGGALVAGAVKENKKGVADALKKENIDNDLVKSSEKSAKTANDWRTGLLATATATSAGATGTAGASLHQAKDLPEKIKKCNSAISGLKVENGKLKAKIEEVKDKLVQIPEGKKFSNTKQVIKSLDTAESKFSVGEKIKENCVSYDEKSANFVKNLSITSTTLTSVGTATGLIGSFTSGFANGHKNEKALDITSNVMAGITAGTGVATIGTSSDTAKRVKDLKEKTEKCENYLKSI